MNSVIDAQTALQALARKEKVKELQRFFKTGPGEYGEGDVFRGVVMPDIRTVARRFRSLSLSQVQKLVASPFHEDRMLGFVILTLQYEKARSDRRQRKAIFDFYLNHRARANNWDLIDVTAPRVLGEWMWENSSESKRLLQWAKSNNLWERRLSVICTQAFIRKGHFADTIAIAEKLLGDEHDLIHKASGWMLRECGKKDPEVLRAFLLQHVRRMPRTMLRYSIEKFSASERARWLQK